MFAAQAPPGLAGNQPACWPMTSDALAVHPEQIPAVRARNRRHGVRGVEYNAKGQAILADRAARRDLMALEGYHDNQGGYGDDHAGESPLPPLPDNPVHPDL